MSSRVRWVSESTFGKPAGVGVLLPVELVLRGSSAPMHESLRYPFSGGRFENTVLPARSMYLHTGFCAAAPAANAAARHHERARTHRFPAVKSCLCMATECSVPRARGAKTRAGTSPAPVVA